MKTMIVQMSVGFFIGWIAAVFGAYIFVLLLTDFDLFSDFQVLRNNEVMGKIITLGAIMNIAVFFILIKMKRELIARGVVLATIALTIVTLFI